MKKKFLSLALVGCLGLTLTGCKGDLDDFNKQMDMLEEVIEKNEIFDDDWSLKTTASDTEAIMKKDGDKYYRKLATGEGFLEEWYIPNGEQYTRYLKTSYEKTYTTVSKDTFDGWLLSMYESFYEEFSEADELCDTEGTTCTIDKTLFGKVTFEMIEDDISSKIVIKKGIIQSVEIKEGEEVTKLEMDYSNQKIKEPNKSEFTSSTLE